MHMDRPVFVFGSDLAGRHDDGDALVALRTRGAVYGRGTGPQGNAYAIPTRRHNGRPRARQDIAESVAKFLHFTRMRPWALFDVAPIGCGLAGYDAEDIRADVRGRAPQRHPAKRLRGRPGGSTTLDETSGGDAS